jgi:hypothetical protein
MLTVVPGDGSGHELDGGSRSLIDEIVREGARRMLAEALQAEVDAYIAAHAAERDENGRRLVVRNGSHQSREVLTSAGAVEVTVPRVNDKRTGPGTGERQRFSSAILAAVVPEDPEDHRGAAAAVPAWPVVRGLRARPGPVPGLIGRPVRPAVITRLTETWRVSSARSPPGTCPGWTTCTCGPTGSM